MENKVSLSIDELNAAISAAVNAAMDAYFVRKKKNVLVPRLEALRLLDKSESTLWRWEKASYLVPALRKGSSVFYWSEDLERLGVVFD